MLLASAEVALSLMQPAIALTTAREAWGLAKSIDDKVLHAKILLAMVNGLNMQGGAKEALKAAKSSMAMVTVAKDDAVLAGLHHAMANAHLKLDDADDAMEAEEKAMALYKKLKDKEGQAGSLTNMAKAQRLLGRFDQATTSANEALEMWRGMGKGAGVAACMETIIDVQAAQGQSQDPLATAEEELSKFQKAGCNTRNELTLMEMIVEVATAQGRPLDACRFLEDMIKVCQAANNKLLEAQRTMRAAEVHSDMNHAQDSLRLAKRAQELFEGLGMNTQAEDAKKLQTSMHVRKGDHAKAPHRDNALKSMKSFIRAVEQREVAQVKQFEVDLDKFSTALKDTEMSNALESLFERDPAALGFLEQQGWDLESFKVPSKIYQYPHKALYLTSLAGGMGFGPQFRGVHPWRKGKASDGDAIRALSCCVLPETEAWQGQIMFRHGIMDAGLQSTASFGFPPF